MRKNSRGDTIHPLSRQLQANSQQFTSNARFTLLQCLPSLITQRPSDTLMFRLDRRRTACITEERQFAAGPARDDKFEVPALRKLVLAAQHAGFKEVEGARDVAFMVQGCAGGEGLAREVGAGREPEIFVLG